MQSPQQGNSTPAPSRSVLEDADPEGSSVEGFDIDDLLRDDGPAL
jgi:hypothetical protein